MIFMELSAMPRTPGRAGNRLKWLNAADPACTKISRLANSASNSASQATSSSPTCSRVQHSETADNSLYRTLAAWLRV